MGSLEVRLMIFSCSGYVYLDRIVDFVPLGDWGQPKIDNVVDG